MDFVSKEKRSAIMRGVKGRAQNQRCWYVRCCTGMDIVFDFTLKSYLEGPGISYPNIE